MRSAPALGAAALLAVLPMPPPASAQDAARLERIAHGRAVAERWCANCHVAGPEARGHAGDAAPPLAAIARMPATTEASLRAFLRAPHAPMPDLALSRAELDGVVSYILGLRDR